MLRTLLYKDMGYEVSYRTCAQGFHCFDTISNKILLLLFTTQAATSY